MPDSYYTKKEVQKRVIKMFEPKHTVNPLREAIRKRISPKRV